MNPRLLLLLFLTQVFAPALFGQYPLFDKSYSNKTRTSLKATAMSANLPASGYLAIKFEARNDEKVPLRWDFDFTSKDNSWEGNQLDSSFTLTCAAGKQKSVEILVPLVTAIHSEGELVLLLRINGRPPLTSSTVEMRSDYSHSWPVILMSEGLDTLNSGPLDSVATGGSRYGSTDFAGAFVPDQLSEDWRAYAGYDAMMLTSTDWGNITPGAKSALMRWNRLGGRLVIYQADPSVSFASLDIEAEIDRVDESEATRTWGSLKLLPLPSSGLLDARATFSLMKSGALAPRAQVTGSSLASSWPLQNFFGERAFNPVFFILILIAFGIVVGPVNLFVFAKADQRHRLFITTPIISLIASALLLVIIVFQDGFGGKGHRLALIEVQPSENTAFIQQQQIARTGVLLKTSFQTKGNALVSPIALDASRWARITPANSGGEARYRIKEGEKSTKELSGDWYKSRSEYGHLVTAVQSTRGRLQLLSPNGQPTVTSTFDFPLKEIYYIDSNGGKWQSSGELKSGRKTQLVPCPDQRFEEWKKEQQRQLNQDARHRFELVLDRQNHFLALAEEGPFIDTLATLRWKESTALISGPVALP